MEEKDGPDDGPDGPEVREITPRPQAHGFFSVYKKGQGYWTRMGTALGAAILITIMAVFVYRQVIAFYPGHRATAVGLTIGIIAAGVLLAWRLMNRPRHVDFLIATDSEMKKVNWTSRKELIGSTRVVILFMFAIAATLFMIDVLTGLFFQIIGLIKVGPLS
jgi:preprotein translocase SecE subunit